MPRYVYTHGQLSYEEIEVAVEADSEAEAREKLESEYGDIRHHDFIEVNESYEEDADLFRVEDGDEFTVTIRQQYEGADPVEAEILTEAASAEEAEDVAWTFFDRNHCRKYSDGKNVIPTSTHVTVVNEAGDAVLEKTV